MDLFQVATGNKVLVIGCESGSVICAHVAKREEIFKKQFSSAVNACTIIGQTIIVGCSDGKVLFNVVVFTNCSFKEYKKIQSIIFNS